MKGYKRNQVEAAIIRALAAEGARRDEVKFRLKRLLAADRRLGRRRGSHEWPRHYAFYTHDPPGSGVEISFSSYEAFALLAAIVLLEHGIPQQAVVKLLRRLREELEPAYAETLKKDPSRLFDEDAVRRQAKPGTLATDNTDPVFMVFARLTGSAVEGGATAAVCTGHAALGDFTRKHIKPGMVFTMFEFARFIHTLADNLSRIQPVNRGRTKGT